MTRTGPEQGGSEQPGSEQGARATGGSRLLMVAVLAVFAAIAVAVGFLVPAVAPPAAAPPAAAPPSPAPAAAPAPVAASGPTLPIVSLTFDDGLAGQMQYLQTMQQHGLVGTFFINSGAIGQPNYMTRADLAQIAASGDEIGGHTVSHPNLTEDAPDETARQICDDRATLHSWGFDPVSFAYPFGAASPPVEAAARDCGYASARLDRGGVGPVSATCPDCVPGESVPPRDPYAIRTPPDITTATTLADLEGLVTGAQAAGGGWVPLIFHHEACTTCGNLSTSPALFDQFAGWLADQQRAGTLAVRTVSQVVGGPGGPVHTAPPPAATAMPNGDLSQSSTTVPDCWEASGFGQNTADYRWTPPAPGVPATETVTVSSYTNGDATLLPRLDLGQCTVTATPGVPIHLAAQYRSTVPTQFEVYRRTSTGSWVYWTSSPWVAPAPAWQPVTWDTPPPPPDTEGVAAGLVVGAVGWVQSAAYVQGPVPPPPAPPLISPGLRGLLELGAAVAAVLGLLAALAGLTHHFLRRRRRGRAGRAGAPTVPGPRSPIDDPPEGSPDGPPDDELATRGAAGEDVVR
ncbi:MAG TPA: polysaccharide deacetylase family protein [Actinomycetospora sp.]|jgi:peptidoglycan/xylan/chitin deacetylase (PgdA/CDA1 family)|uniref:polysaccharide deacetylase family protein n=1 Tax=Actinomycetospora sp. TaxID=1872135 RepID=UPI002F3FF2AE